MSDARKTKKAHTRQTVSIDVPLWYLRLENKLEKYRYRESIFPILFMLSIIPAALIVAFAFVLLHPLVPLDEPLFGFAATIPVWVAIVGVIYRRYLRRHRLIQVEAYALYLAAIGIDLKKGLMDNDLMTYMAYNIASARKLNRALADELSDATHGVLKAKMLEFDGTLEKVMTIYHNIDEYEGKACNLSANLVTLGEYIFSYGIEGIGTYVRAMNELVAQIKNERSRFGWMRRKGEWFLKQHLVVKYIILLVVILIVTAFTPSEYQVYVFVALFTVITTPVVNSSYKSR